MKLSDFDKGFYQKSPQTVLGFHGCDRSVAEEILNSQEKHLKPSENTYDWLGNGIYFWLNDPKRAYEWACRTQERYPSKVREPYVIGAIIDLGMCLNFCERQSITLLQKAYSVLQNQTCKMEFDALDELKNKFPDAGGFELIRPLDCTVINQTHKIV